MWIVAKIKLKEIDIFKKDLIEKAGKETKFYYPKIIFKKFLNKKTIEQERPIIKDYLFCFNPNFSDKKIINNFKYLKGLSYFLNDCKLDQKNINDFINHCKKFENDRGYLLPSFFNSILKNKGKFISGPFKNLVFDIIEKHKNVLKIQTGNFTTTIIKNNYLYIHV